LTLKGSAVVVIGAGRHEVGRDDAPAGAFTRTPVVRKSAIWRMRQNSSPRTLGLCGREQVFDQCRTECNYGRGGKEGPFRGDVPLGDSGRDGQGAAMLADARDARVARGACRSRTRRAQSTRRLCARGRAGSSCRRSTGRPISREDLPDRSYLTGGVERGAPCASQRG
jgi:hypothetical protein